MANVLNAITKAFNTGVVKVKKFSPEICIAGGIATAVAAVVVACKETLKVEKILEEHNEAMEKIHTYDPGEGEEPTEFINSETDETDTYSHEDAKRDTVLVYVKTGAKLAKNYLPAALLLTTSITLTLCGFKILKARHIALLASFTGLKESYDSYRAHIKDKFGNKEDLEALLGLERNQELTEDIDTNTNEISVKTEEKVNITRKDDDSDYVRIFNRESAPHDWKSNAGFNMGFLSSAEAWATNKLKLKGHLFLNEVYDMLGMSHTRTGALCGWVLNDEGDNYVSFGIHRVEDIDIWHQDPDFVLEFNCQGPIYDKI